MQQLHQKKRSLDEDGEVQVLAFLKRIKRGAESDEKRAKLKQQEIFIPQRPELAIKHYYNCVIGVYPSRISLALKCSNIFYPSLF